MGKTKARYSHVEFRIEDWTITRQTGRDGETYRVEGLVDGRCPTEICNAICCRTADIYEGKIGSGPCHLLNEETLGCKAHEKGAACKPIACLVWPVRQGDIDSTNEKAERLGFKERCQLRLVKA